MSPRVRYAVILALATALGACEVMEPFTTAPSAVVTSRRVNAVPAERTNGVAIGRSTRADVAAALGRTLVINFDNGYEIWVYRIANAPGAEYLVLFSPSGVVTKTRLRPAPATDRRG